MRALVRQTQRLRRKFGRVAPIPLLFLMTACQPTPEFTSTVTTVPSRGVEIPVTFIQPVSEAKDPVPLVVMVHGHGGSREEAGGFVRVAESLAEQGIASIRMDFPGCGDSSESFTENYLSNMLADIRASRAFALQHESIDTDNVGILGYSMGGRLAILASLENDYDLMAMWNPVGSDGPGSMIKFLGSEDAYVELRSVARREGAADFVTPWGDEQRLSREWFEQMEESTPLTDIRHYDGELFILFGDEDEVVDPQISRDLAHRATGASSVTLHRIPGGKHGLGFYLDDKAAGDETVAETVEFFRSGFLDIGV